MKLKTAVKIGALGASAALIYGISRRRKAKLAEIERLAAILGWAPGCRVADVGAGGGVLAVVAARRVGRDGHVFVTDVEAKKIERMRKYAARKGLANMSFFQASQDEAGLPPECCDAMVLRGSYHHFTKPSAVNAGLYRAMRPGGALAAIDFPPRRFLTIVAPVKGVPANRGGHGIPRHIVIEELMEAGFGLETEIPKWSRPDLYCVVFRKPKP